MRRTIIPLPYTLLNAACGTRAFMSLRHRGGGGGQGEETKGGLGGTEETNFAESLLLQKNSTTDVFARLRSARGVCCASLVSCALPLCHLSMGTVELLLSLKLLIGPWLQRVTVLRVLRVERIPLDFHE